MTESEKIKCAIHCLKTQAEIEVCEECKAYNMDSSTCIEIAREGYKALEEILAYKEGKLCLIPKEVYKIQCEQLDDYKEIGTPDEIRAAMKDALSEIISIRKSLESLITLTGKTKGIDEWTGK